MTKHKSLGAEALRRRCDPDRFTFETTAELEDLTEVLGQARATEAIRFGIGIRRDGYNLFALGSPGTGRYTVVHKFLEEQSAGEPVPPDLCYVNNFDDPHKPRVLQLPAGTGVKLRDDIEHLLEDLRGAIPAVFESDEYRARRQELEQQIKEQHEHALEELRKEAEKHEVALIRTPAGMAFAPTRKGEVLSPDEFNQLPEEEQKRVEAVVAALQEKLERIIHQLPQLRREGQQRIRELDREVTMAAVGNLIKELKKRYAELPDVVAYLEAVEQSIIDNADDFRRPEEGQEITLFGVSVSRTPGAAAALRRYHVNVLVDNSESHGAPVVYEDNPNYHNLIGRIADRTVDRKINHK